MRWSRPAKTVRSIVRRAWQVIRHSVCFATAGCLYLDVRVLACFVRRRQQRAVAVRLCTANRTADVRTAQNRRLDEIYFTVSDLYRISYLSDAIRPTVGASHTGTAKAAHLVRPLRAVVP